MSACFYIKKVKVRMLFCYYVIEVQHHLSYHGLEYTIISHIPKYDLIPQIIPHLFAENNEYFLVGNRDEGMVFNCKEFMSYCREEYFYTHFKEIMEQDVICLPYVDENAFSTNSVLKSPFDTILKTMKNWCKKNKKGIMKGLIIYGYSLDSHLEFLKFPKCVSQNEQYCTLAEDLHQTVITYNPIEQVILLIKRAGSKDLEDEMKLSVSDLIKFVLIYNAILKKSGITLINLLVTEEVIDNYPWKCKYCKTHVIPMKTLDSVQFFEQWWVKKDLHNKSFIFKRKGSSHESNIKDFSHDFSAFILGFLAQYQSTTGKHFQGMLPALTNNAENQIEESVMISPKQLSIVNSSEKRLIIKGCHGSGISIVARERATAIAKTLEEKEEEILYYICYDSISQQLEAMQNICQVKLFPNNSGKKLSEILSEIVRDEPKQKTHIIVDLFDCEDLDDAEVDTLNNLLRTDLKLKDSILSLFCKPVEKRRIVDNVEKKSNMISDLEGMNVLELKYNMRNTIEIKNFLEFTVNALTRQKTNKTTTFFLRHRADTNKSVSQLESDFTGKSIALSVQTATSNPLVHKKRDPENQVKERKNRKAKTEPSKVTEPRVSKKAVKLNAAKKSSSKCRLTFDEALEYCETSSDDRKIAKKIENIFCHIKSTKCGHNVTFAIPSVYQINHSKNSNEFGILLALVLRVIFRDGKENWNRYDISELENITNGYEGKKTVILHFDVQNDIPQYLQLVFKFMGIHEKVTDKYEEFKRDDKKILICNYRSFGGLYCKRVIVMLYPSIYYLKHHLPECISYSTAYLSIIVLTEVKLVENANEEKETVKRLIDTWKNSSNNEPLVNLQSIEMEIFDEESGFEEPQSADVNTTELKFKMSSKLCSKLIARISEISTVPDKNNQKEVNAAVER